jgi:hypothetical protein
MLLVSITAILDLARVNVPRSTYVRRQGYPDLCDLPLTAQRTATGVHGDSEAVITPGRKTGAEEGFEWEVVEKRVGVGSRAREEDAE